MGKELPTPATAVSDEHPNRVNSMAQSGHMYEAKVLFVSTACGLL